MVVRVPDWLVVLCWLPKRLIPPFDIRFTYPLYGGIQCNLVGSPAVLIWHCLYLITYIFRNPQTQFSRKSANAGQDGHRLAAPTDRPSCGGSTASPT